MFEHNPGNDELEFCLICVELIMNLLSNVFVLILSEPVRRYKTFQYDIFSTSSESPSIISSETDFRQGEQHLRQTQYFSLFEKQSSYLSVHSLIIHKDWGLGQGKARSQELNPSPTPECQNTSSLSHHYCLLQ